MARASRTPTGRRFTHYRTRSPKSIISISRTPGILIAIPFVFAACIDGATEPTIIVDPPTHPGSGLVMEISGWPEPFYAVGQPVVDAAGGDPLWTRSAGYFQGDRIVAADIGDGGTGDVVVLSLPRAEVGEYPFDADCDPEERDEHDGDCVLGVLNRGLTGWDSETAERWEFVTGSVTVTSSAPDRLEGRFSGTMNRVDESGGEVTATAEVTRGEFGVAREVNDR